MARPLLHRGNYEQISNKGNQNEYITKKNKEQSWKLAR